MLIAARTFEVDQVYREVFTSRLASIRATRIEAGRLEDAASADLVDDTRVSALVEA